MVLQVAFFVPGHVEIPVHEIEPNEELTNDVGQNERPQNSTTMTTTFFTLDELGLRSRDNLRGVDVSAEDEFAADPFVFEINDLATLAELQPLWRELLDQTEQPAFSQTFEWLHLYLEHFGDQYRLRALCLDADGESTGLTVLVERNVRGVRELTLPSVGGETLWPLGGNPAGQWRAVARHLRAELARKTVLDLRGVFDPLGEINAALYEGDADVHSQPWSSATMLRCDENFESAWLRVSPAVRQLVEQGEQRLAALGTTNFVRFRPRGTDCADPHFPDELYQDCLNIALNDEQQLKRSDSVLNAPERHLFLRDLLPWAWRHSAADLCLLLSGSRPIAFRFHTLMSGHLRTIWSGVDAEFRQLPLAALLLYRTLRDSCHRRDVVLDLGPTHSDVALNWQADVTPFRRFVVGASAPASSAQLPEEMNLYGL
jgi:CelD/BcsL family acetyltransferase involved in cellulose biosynthesis